MRKQSFHSGRSSHHVVVSGVWKRTVARTIGLGRNQFAGLRRTGCPMKRLESTLGCPNQPWWRSVDVLPSWRSDWVFVVWDRVVVPRVECGPCETGKILGSRRVEVAGRSDVVGPEGQTVVSSGKGMDLELVVEAKRDPGAQRACRWSDTDAPSWRPSAVAVQEHSRTVEVLSEWPTRQASASRGAVPLNCAV